MSRPPAPDSGANPDHSGPGTSHAPHASVAALDCRTAVRRLWDYLDGGLSAPARSEVEAHLAACAECPPHFAFAAATLRALAGTRVAPLSIDDTAALRTRVLAVIGAAGAR